MVNKFEAPLEEKHQQESIAIYETPEETFKRYVEYLDLSPEDLKKKTLDVGSNNAQFAKWAKDQGINSEIYSLEPGNVEMVETDKSVRGSSDEIPYDDESFELVISNNAVPQPGFFGDDKKSIKKSLEEMLRVLKKGGEMRLSPIRFDNFEFDWQKTGKEALDQVIQELVKEYDIEVDKVEKEHKAIKAEDEDQNYAILKINKKV